jgi:hypothetical protein
MQDRIVRTRSTGPAPMQAMHAARGPRRAGSVIASALAALACLSACSSLDTPFTVFADPGKYQYYSCEQIASATKATSARQEGLRQLMDRAEQSTGGVVASVLAYRADYATTTEELKVLQATARDKNCDSPENWRSSATIR